MKYKLIDLCDIQIGRTPPRKEFQWFNTGATNDFTWVSIKDLGDCNKYINSSSETISCVGQKKFNIPIVKAGTILLSFKLTVGRVAIATKDLLTNEAIAQLPIKDPSKVDRDFLYYYLLKFPWSTLGSTSSIATAINSKIIKEMEVELPDTITQRKIANILSILDEKINNNKAINDNLLQQIMTIFNDRFPNISDGDQLISDYLLPKRGKGLLSKDAIFGPVPVIAGGLEPATYHNQSNTNCPVITISASGANAGYVRLWNQKVWSSDSSYIDSSVTKYVYFWFSLLKSRQQEIFDSQTGSAQPHIYPQHIGALKLSKLDIDEVSRFNYGVTPLFELIGRNNDENQYLCEIRDSLLPKLMNGEINLEAIEL